MNIKQMEELKEYVDEYQKEHPHIRRGQAYMNRLFEIDKDVYDAVLLSNNDPFYDDKKIEKFLKFLEENSI